jgi:hypothetical protein
LLLVALRREEWEQAADWKHFSRLFGANLATTNFALFDTPVDLIVRLQSRRVENGLRQGRPALFVNSRGVHETIIPVNSLTIKQRFPSETLTFRWHSVRSNRPARKLAALESAMNFPAEKDDGRAAYQRRPQPESR